MGLTLISIGEKNNFLVIVPGEKCIQVRLLQFDNPQFLTVYCQSEDKILSCFISEKYAVCLKITVT